MEVETFLDIKSLIDIALCTYRTATNQSNIVWATTDTLWLVLSFRTGFGLQLLRFSVK